MLYINWHIKYWHYIKSDIFKQSHRILYRATIFIYFSAIKCWYSVKDRHDRWKNSGNFAFITVRMSGVAALTRKRETERGAASETRDARPWTRIPWSIDRRHAHLLTYINIENSGGGYTRANASAMHPAISLFSNVNMQQSVNKNDRDLCTPICVIFQFRSVSNIEETNFNTMYT